MRKPSDFIWEKKPISQEEIAIDKAADEILAKYNALRKAIESGDETPAGHSLSTEKGLWDTTRRIVTYCFPSPLVADPMATRLLMHEMSGLGWDHIMIYTQSTNGVDHYTKLELTKIEGATGKSLERLRAGWQVAYRPTGPNGEVIRDQLIPFHDALVPVPDQYAARRTQLAGLGALPDVSSRDIMNDFQKACIESYSQVSEFWKQAFGYEPTAAELLQGRQDMPKEMAEFYKLLEKAADKGNYNMPRKDVGEHDMSEGAQALQTMRMNKLWEEIFGAPPEVNEIAMALHRLRTEEETATDEAFAKIREFNKRLGDAIQQHIASNKAILQYRPTKEAREQMMTSLKGTITEDLMREAAFTPPPTQPGVHLDVIFKDGEPVKPAVDLDDVRAQVRDSAMRGFIAKLDKNMLFMPDEKKEDDK